MIDVVILGGGGFAREVFGVFEDCNAAKRSWNILGFIDENEGAQGRELCDLPVLGDFSWFASQRVKPQVICGVGSNGARRKFATQARSLGLSFCSVIHPSVQMSRFLDIGEGNVVCAGCSITTQVYLGSHINLNLHCTVGHDVIVSDFCNLSPGVHLSGYSRLDEGVDAGTGAVVLPSKRVGCNSIIGAGAVVTEDIPAHSLAVGIPARVIRTLAS